MIKSWHFFKYEDGTTGFYLDPKDLEQLVYQNKGTYTGNFATGCLLDSFVLACERGYLFVYEHYLNANSSDYSCLFVPYELGKKHEKAYDKAWSKWLEFEAAAEEG